jgi:hypothetical protein
MMLRHIDYSALGAMADSIADLCAAAAHPEQGDNPQDLAAIASAEAGELREKIRGAIYDLEEREQRLTSQRLSEDSSDWITAPQGFRLPGSLETIRKGTQYRVTKN